MPYLFAAVVVCLFFYLLYRRRGELPRGRKDLYTYIWALSALLLTMAMVLYPKEAFEASVAGLQVWWNIVFPALLPFFIFAQILIGLGVVHMMGVFLEPVMRPLFNVPGTGAFVMAMGLASGFPIGAILTTELRLRKLCNRVEAERLLCFTNTADPLFMFGAVAVGMLGYPQAGFTIAIAHYLSSITLGIIMRFYRCKEISSREKIGREPGAMIVRALHALVEARERDARPLGQLMGDAIRNSVNTLLLIGGFIILFSVIIRVLDVIGLVDLLSRVIAIPLQLIGMSKELAPALLSGFFEIDLGCQDTALLENVTLKEKIIASSMIIAWSGLSVHAQVASIIAQTDLRIAPYIAARAFHAVLAGIYSALLVGPGNALTSSLVLPVALQAIPTSNISFWWSRTSFMLNQLLIFICILLVIALILYITRITRAKFFL